MEEKMTIKSWEEKMLQGHIRITVNIDEWKMRILAVVTARPTAMLHTVSSGS